MSETKRFTQEDLLNAMGLKVGDTVSVDDKYEDLFVGVVEVHKDSGSIGIRSEETFLRLSEIIRNGYEYSVITPPKYTLTETEKHIVLAIDENIELLHRNNGRLSYCYKDHDINGTPIMEWVEIPVSKLFPFIKDNDYVSLDELREIAKK